MSQDQGAGSVPQPDQNCEVDANGKGLLCYFCAQMVGCTAHTPLESLCEICNESFACYGLLQHHMTNYTTNCNNCQRTVHGVDAMALHEHTNKCSACKRDPWLQMRPSSAVCKDVFRGRCSSMVILKCWICPTILNTLREKIAHQSERTCHCGMQFRCHSQFTSHTTKNTCKPLHHGDRIKCKTCCMHCKTTEDLNKHLEKQFECDECKCKFNCASFPRHECKKDDKLQTITTDGATKHTIHVQQRHPIRPQFNAACMGTQVDLEHSTDGNEAREQQLLTVRPAQVKQEIKIVIENVDTDCEL